jgi:hypothetical protein
LQSSGLANKIEVKAPANIIVKDSSGNAFTGILNNPISKSTTVASQAGVSNVLSVVEFGNSKNSSLQFKNTAGNSVNVNLRVPVPGGVIGQTVKVYYSQDGTTWNNQATVTLGGIEGVAYAFFNTNHATMFAIGATTGSFTINNDAASTVSQSVTLTMS